MVVVVCSQHEPNTQQLLIRNTAVFCWLAVYTSILPLSSNHHTNERARCTEGSQARAEACRNASMSIRKSMFTYLINATDGGWTWAIDTKTLTGVCVCVCVCVCVVCMRIHACM